LAAPEPVEKGVLRWFGPPPLPKHLSQRRTTEAATSPSAVQAPAQRSQDDPCSRCSKAVVITERAYLK